MNLDDARDTLLLIKNEDYNLARPSSQIIPELVQVILYLNHRVEQIIDELPE
jgi:hypothetical protein